MGFLFVCISPFCSLQKVKNFSQSQDKQTHFLLHFTTKVHFTTTQKSLKDLTSMLYTNSH